MKDNRHIKQNDVPSPVDEYLDTELFNQNSLDERDEIAEADPMIREAMQKEASSWEQVHLLHKPQTLYSGSGTEMEILELEDAIRYLIQEGRYSYASLEDYLIALRYSLKDIRKAFEKVTGISPLYYLNKLKVFENAPSIIPPVSLGWGKSKAKDYDYLFLMPYRAGYQVFGQKGDIIRDEVEYFLDFESAIEYLNKKASKVEMREPKLDDVEIRSAKDILDPIIAPIMRKTSKEYSNISDYFYSNSDFISDHEVKSIIAGTLDKGEITQEDATELLIETGMKKTSAEITELDEAEEELRDNKQDMRDDMIDYQEQDVDEMLGEVTPQEYFENETKDDTFTASKAIEDVMVYIGNKSEALSNFTLEIISFKYQIFEETEVDIEPNADVNNNNDIDEYLSADALIPVLVTVTNNSDEDFSISELKGMMLFGVVDGSIITDDQIKMDNNRVYAMTNEGIFMALEDFNE